MKYTHHVHIRDRETGDTLLLCGPCATKRGVVEWIPIGGWPVGHKCSVCAGDCISMTAKFEVGKLARATPKEPIEICSSNGITSLTVPSGSLGKIVAAEHEIIFGGKVCWRYKLEFNVGSDVLLHHWCNESELEEWPMKLKS